MTDTNGVLLLAQDAVHHSGLWQPDMAIVRGEGSTVFDADGRAFIDCMAGIAVASVGHGNPRLTEAIAMQAARLISCPQNVANDTRSAFVDKLFGFVRAPLERVFLANSGSEINEAALKWARAATGRSRFVAAKRGFSGRTLGALALTWEKNYREPFGPLPYESDFVRYNDVEALEQTVDDRTAAVFLEPIQGEGGIHVAAEGYLEAAREITRDRGALLVMDEIQTGVGRTGTFLASDHHRFDPDMVTLAKGLGGGVPIGALLMTDEVAKAMPTGGHGTTFGGNPLASAAALAVLEEIETRNLLSHARDMGTYFREGLEAIGSPKVRAVRGRGLMLGLELKEKVAPYLAHLRANGVLTINAGATVIRFVPPLIIDRTEVDQVLDRVAQALVA